MHVYIIPNYFNGQELYMGPPAPMHHGGSSPFPDPDPVPEPVPEPKQTSPTKQSEPE